MPRLTVEVSDDTAARLKELAQRCSEIDKERSGGTTHGELTAKALLAMLAEDAAMILSRPGSWEASNMATVFASHGYEV